MNPILEEALERLRWGSSREDGMSVDLTPLHCNAIYDALEHLMTVQETATLPSIDVGTRVLFEGRTLEVVVIESVPGVTLDEASEIHVNLEQRTNATPQPVVATNLIADRDMGDGGLW